MSVFGQVCHFAETHIFILAGLIIHDKFFFSTTEDFDYGYHMPPSEITRLTD